jgi:hypothetical protein
VSVSGDGRWQLDFSRDDLPGGLHHTQNGYLDTLLESRGRHLCALHECSSEHLREQDCDSLFARALQADFAHRDDFTLGLPIADTDDPIYKIIPSR